MEVPNTSYNQEPEPFEVTAIDFDPLEANASVETCVLEETAETPKEARNSQHGFRPSDVPGKNLGPCAEIVLERLSAEEPFLVSN